MNQMIESVSEINEEALRAFADGLTLGFPPETENELLERSFPEVKHISPESSPEERALAFAQLRKRLGLSTTPDVPGEK